MSELGILNKKVEQLQASIGVIEKYTIPIQEFVRPEVITFTGTITSAGVITQPTNYFTVNAAYWLYIRAIHTYLTEVNAGGNVANRDYHNIRFNIEDSGRGYSFFNTATTLYPFSPINIKNPSDSFVGILAKPNANIRANLSTVVNPSIDVNVGIILIGDLVAPEYLKYYFAKNLWRK
jgi:hypothetical protein